MDIKSCHIQNIKAIGSDTINLNLAEDIITAIGPNGVGKSSLLTAISLFFTPYKTPDPSVFHQYNTDKEHSAEITVTFHHLTDTDTSYEPLADYLYTDADEEQVWTLTKRFFKDPQENRITSEYLIYNASSEQREQLASDTNLRIDWLFEPSQMQWIHVPAQAAVCEGEESPFSQL
ncbi:MAG: AAA family ATPase, partial [Candidatus Paceibacteria bacterium]